MTWERPAWLDAMHVDWPTGQHGDAEIRTIGVPCPHGERPERGRWDGRE